ncbi:MAG: transglutaminase-like domain-containing protein [Chloroflexi bacterium]|nr:transglutaminase-like domain-containing protein [Chloroflexota bacterium]MDA1219568.1 transglutaminase-like domain-containing protein [Chloroflexota bacterium]
MSQLPHLQEFSRIASLPDEQVDLARAALLIASVECPELDIEHQLGLLDSLAAAATRRIETDAEPLVATNQLSEYLFDEVGFRGNEEDYYDPRNSFLNQVLRRRVGIPITLSLVCIEVGRRLNIPLIAIGMPGHLLVRHRDVSDWFIDPFHGGILLSQEECQQRLQQIAQATIPWDASYLTPLSNREFVARILGNLKGIYLQQKDYPRALAILDHLVLIRPEYKQELRDRGAVYFRLERYQDALDDLQSYLTATAPAKDTKSVERLMEQIRQAIATGR